MLLIGGCLSVCLFHSSFFFGLTFLFILKKKLESELLCLITDMMKNNTSPYSHLSCFCALKFRRYGKNWIMASSTFFIFIFIFIILILILILILFLGQKSATDFFCYYFLICNLMLRDLLLFIFYFIF